LLIFRSFVQVNLKEKIDESSTLDAELEGLINHVSAHPIFNKLTRCPDASSLTPPTNKTDIKASLFEELIQKRKQEQNELDKLVKKKNRKSFLL